LSDVSVPRARRGRPSSQSAEPDASRTDAAVYTHSRCRRDSRPMAQTSPRHPPRLARHQSAVLGLTNGLDAVHGQSLRRRFLALFQHVVDGELRALERLELGQPAEPLERGGEFHFRTALARASIIGPMFRPSTTSLYGKRSRLALSSTSLRSAW